MARRTFKIEDRLEFSTVAGIVAYTRDRPYTPILCSISSSGSANLVGKSGTAVCLLKGIGDTRCDFVLCMSNQGMMFLGSINYSDNSVEIKNSFIPS